jgi:transcriptional regulator with XRE-family HTH domain
MPEISFAERLKTLRAAAGITQAVLAERAGMNSMAVSRLELGKRQPTWESVKALARALGVTVLAFDPPPAKKKGKRS